MRAGSVSPLASGTCRRRPLYRDTCRGTPPATQPPLRGPQNYTRPDFLSCIGFRTSRCFGAPIIWWPVSFLEAREPLVERVCGRARAVREPQFVSTGAPVIGATRTVGPDSTNARAPASARHCSLSRPVRDHVGRRLGAALVVALVAVLSLKPSTAQVVRRTSRTATGTVTFEGRTTRRSASPC